MAQLTDAARQQIAHDPTRPRYHFCAPYGWMNDPNGTVYHAGYYHVFYQWNPDGDHWGNIHWGHARSRDLVTWEHLPVALRPAPEHGEEHCFSGCLALRGKAPPLILYTAVGPQMEVLTGAQQWAAVGDDQLLTWQKHPRNPLLTAPIHGGLTVLDWRDPFVFADNGRTFLLLGGKLSQPDGGAAVVLLYEAQDATLERWAYRGVLFRHPDLTRTSVECANLFKSGRQWVLLLSTHTLVEYYVGEFDADTGRFHAQASGLLDGSDQFYATNLLHDEQPRSICFGWIRGFAPNRGWSGCLSLPRVLSVDQAGRLRQAPAPEVDQLRGPGLHAADLGLGTFALAGLHGAGLDVQACVTAEPHAEFGMRLVPLAAGAQAVTLTSTPQAIRLNDKLMPYDRVATVDLRLLLDRSVVEVFVDSRVALTVVLPPPASAYRVELFSDISPARLLQLDAWPMTSP